MALLPSAARTLVLPALAASPRGFVPAQVKPRWPDKHPSAVLDYGVDLRNRIDAADSVLLLNAAVTPSAFVGLAIVDQFAHGTVVAVRLRDGILGADYLITFTVGTANGRALVIPVSLFVSIVS